MLIRVWDCETTGLPGREPPGEPPHQIIEIGAVDVAVTNGRGRIAGTWSSLVRPTRPIGIEAMAVHHLTDEDVAGGAPQSFVAQALLAPTVEPVSAFCAHNAAFEQAFFDGAGKPWLDTWKIALRLWPDLPSHANQVVRYGLPLALDRDHATPAHRALPDAYVTAHILLAALERAAIPELIAWSIEPASLSRMPFGKHRGATWADIPADYIDWLLGQAGLDANVAFSARLERDRRRRESGAAG